MNQRDARHSSRALHAENGIVNFDAVHPGTYWLWIQPDGFASQSHLVEVSENNEASIRSKHTSGDLLVGQLFGFAERNEITAMLWQEDEYFGIIHPLIVDQSGKFFCEDLQPNGAYWLAGFDDHTPLFVRTINLGVPDRSLTHIDIHISEPAGVVATPSLVETRNDSVSRYLLQSCDEFDRPLTSIITNGYALPPRLPGYAENTASWRVVPAPSHTGTMILDFTSERRIPAEHRSHCRSRRPIARPNFNV